MKNSDFEKVLQKSFSLPGFRKGQREIITAVLEKKDVLAVLPTGGGKSLCYQFPALWTQQLVIVISPLIALMRDQVASLHRMGLRAGCLYSGQTDQEKRALFQEMNEGGPFVLYLSPERVQKEGFKKWIMNRQIALFAVDEAHCVSQWGHDFRAEYTQINVLKTLRPDIPILALTASATPLVLNDISKNLSLNKPEKMVHGFYRPNLFYQVEACADEEDKLEYLTQSLRQIPTGRKLIYCGTRKQTEELAKFLDKKFDGVDYYHAGLSTGERTRVQEQYIRSELKILVATNAFGMGIDQPDVRLVVHYQLPANIDSLYQEMGRAGRDEKESNCLLLYAKADKGLQSFFIMNADAPKAIKDSRWRNLEALVNYAEGSECRHGEILTYYRDSQRLRACGHCDACEPKSERKIVKAPRQTAVISAASQVKLRSKVKKKPSMVEVTMDSLQEKRFVSLKSWRKQKAIELDLPAFVVFSDQTLKHLSVKNPQNLDEMKLVHGIGDMKLEKFGWDILAQLQQVD